MELWGLNPLCETGKSVYS